MHTIEPFERWLKYYNPYEDELSPYFGEQQDIYFTQSIYDHYIHPSWDSFGSETLYVKVLYVDYDQKAAVIELMGEWNDTLYNDIMSLKRDLIDLMTGDGINKFILIGENVLNFHGSDDCYYEEWYEELNEGWIAAVGFREFIVEEWAKFGVDYYVNVGGGLDDFFNWRTLNPLSFIQNIGAVIQNRLGC